MELNSISIEAVKMTRALPRKRTLIIPLGDIQYQPNEELCDIERLKRVVAFGVENDAYFIGMGDYVDFGSPSNRAKLKALLAEGHLYDSAEDALDAAAELHLDKIKTILEPTRGRWLGLLEGHHFWTFATGDTTDTRLAQFLGCPFLGTSAMVQVRFANPEGDRHGSPSFVIWAHHGRGGGKLITTPLNQLEQVVKGFDADVYLVGHHHKISAGRMQRIVPRFSHRFGNHDLVHKDMILAATGSFLKGFVAGSQRQGRAGGLYPEKGMMNPVSLGVVKLWANPSIGEGIPKVELSVEA